jgi:sugar-specific transcriptional regulator TrmB
MLLIELLQQIGLNKYEAEAYITLLAEGPPTGYELGKRSAVPLSQSYEILERLTQKGLVPIKPADPVRSPTPASRLCSTIAVASSGCWSPQHHARP